MFTDALANPSMYRPHLSVVVPCYDESAVIDELCRRLTAACRQVAGHRYEIVLVNDGSRDDTWSRMVTLATSDERIVPIDLSRNFGHQLALSAGLTFARGQRILIIDADLQDPPELLPDMFRLMDEGASVVYGQRLGRSGETRFKRWTARAFYRLLSSLTDVDIPVDTGDFRLMERRVLDVLNSMPEQHRFIRGMVAWAGFKQIAIGYERAPRHAGNTKYPLRKMIRFALDAITGFSTRPLRLGFYLACSLLVVAGLLAVYVVYAWWFLNSVKGWASLLILVLVFSSTQLLVLSIIGEYVGRTYLQSKGRPLYVVREVFSATTVTNNAQRQPEI